MGGLEEQGPETGKRRNEDDGRLHPAATGAACIRLRAVMKACRFSEGTRVLGASTLARDRALSRQARPSRVLVLNCGASAALRVTIPSRIYRQLGWLDRGGRRSACTGPGGPGLWRTDVRRLGRARPRAVKAMPSCRRAERAGRVVAPASQRLRPAPIPAHSGL